MIQGGDLPDVDIEDLDVGDERDSFGESGEQHAASNRLRTAVGALSSDLPSPRPRKSTERLP